MQHSTAGPAILALSLSAVFYVHFINFSDLIQCQLPHRTGHDGLVSLDVHYFSFSSDSLPQELSLLGLGESSGQMFQLIITTFLQSAQEIRDLGRNMEHIQRLKMALLETEG